MNLVKLQVENYRSFTNKEIDFAAKTALLGDNGSGKSSLIEAIRLLSVGKSFRTSRFDECITSDQPYFRIQAVLKNEQPEKLELFYGLPFRDSPIKEKRLTLNGQEQNYLEFLGKFPSVVFTPSDIEIVLGTPQDRRRYLDAVLWQVDATFRQDYLQLTRTLKERSSLLFLIKINRAGRDELNPWNEILGNLSGVIRSKRRSYIDFLNNFLIKSKDKLVVETIYKESESDLERIIPEEIRMAQNLFGPHRDDLEVSVNDRSARRFASRGQARSAAVLFKLAEAEYLKQKGTSLPLILLDDLFSELDEHNSHYLLSKIEKEYQIVATSTHENAALKNWHSHHLP